MKKNIYIEQAKTKEISRAVKTDFHFFLFFFNILIKKNFKSIFNIKNSAMIIFLKERENAWKKYNEGIKKVLLTGVVK